MSTTTTTQPVCHDCRRPVGLLAGNQARPYVTEHLPGGQRHHCRSRSGCRRARFAAAAPERPTFTLITSPREHG